jgi:hypothetical protein
VGDGSDLFWWGIGDEGRGWVVWVCMCEEGGHVGGIRVEGGEWRWFAGIVS